MSQSQNAASNLQLDDDSANIQSAIDEMKPERVTSISPKVIALEGKSSPDLPLAKGELILLDVSQGWRDLGLVAKICSHKGRLIITNRRAVIFRKKTKDYDIEQLRLTHAGYVSMGHRLHMIKFTSGLFMAVMGVSIMISGQVSAGAVPVLAGVVGMFTARRQGLRILGSGGAMVFDTKSVKHAELAKVLTVINGSA